MSNSAHVAGAPRAVARCAPVKGRHVDVSARVAGQRPSSRGVTFHVPTWSRDCPNGAHAQRGYSRARPRHNVTHVILQYSSVLICVLWTWMKLTMDTLQTLTFDVSIHLRRRNIRVSQHLLKSSQIGSPFQKMRGK